MRSSSDSGADASKFIFSNGGLSYEWCSRARRCWVYCSDSQLASKKAITFVEFTLMEEPALVKSRFRCAAQLQVQRGWRTRTQTRLRERITNRSPNEEIALLLLPLCEVAAWRKESGSRYTRMSLSLSQSESECVDPPYALLGVLFDIAGFLGKASSSLES